MVVLFVPGPVHGGPRRTAGSSPAQHLVGVQLCPSFAVVTSFIDQRDRLPLEVLQEILNSIEVPRTLAAAPLTVLGQVDSSWLQQRGRRRAGVPSPSSQGLQAFTLTPRADGSREQLQSVVLFNPPDPTKHHFLALNPVRLHFAASRTTHTSNEAQNPQTAVSGAMEGKLQGAVNLINATHQLDSLLRVALKAGQSMQSLPLSSAHNCSTAQRARALVQCSVQLVGRSLLLLVEAPLPPGLPSLKDLSAFCNQLSIRAHQAVLLSYQLSSLRRTIPPPSEVAAARANYIAFFNTVWLVLNDLIVGQALRSIVIGNADQLAAFLGPLMQISTVDVPLHLLKWLNHWPAGLKLNTELSAFACVDLSALIRTWDEGVLRHLIASLPSILRLIGLGGFLGASSVLALSSDLLWIATAHLYVAYLIATLAYRWMAILLRGLFDVFRGKRSNVLRKRVDSTTYTVDQLLVGTILFTVLVFLFPTVLAYYTLVASSRAVIILAHAVLDSSLSFLNHYPLFAIMLRIKSPARLPGGVHLQPTRQPGVLRLTNQPLAMSAVLKQHFLLSAQILSVHYSPLRLMRAFVKGEVVTPLSNLQAPSECPAESCCQ